MIRANELRIGNWVTDEFKDARKLISVEKTAVEFEHGIRNIYKNLKPIPLTEEWLEKFGFIEDENADGYYTTKEAINGHDYLVLETPFETAQLGHELIWSYSFLCKYVHQLQNLYFALTGEELTIIEEEL